MSKVNMDISYKCNKQWKYYEQMNIMNMDIMKPMSCMDIVDMYITTLWI